MKTKMVADMLKSLTTDPSRVELRALLYWPDPDLHLNRDQFCGCGDRRAVLNATREAINFKMRLAISHVEQS